jgi:hypothetical protein
VSRFSLFDFKKLQGYENVWSVRISDQFRAVGERSGDVIEWGVDRVA